MRSVSLRLVDLERKPLIPLGFEGENEYMTINFDCKTVFDKHPAAVPTLAVTPPQGDSYPAVVVRDGDIVSWTVCDSDLVYPGEGELQLTFVDGTIIGKTYKARTKVLDSITPSGEAPTPIQNWLIQAAAALQALPTEVASSVAALMGAMVGIGETLDPDDDVTVNYDPVNNTLTIGVPHGRDGEDGHTPAIAAEKVGKVATFYVDGVAIVQISDGQDADPTTLIDDTSTAQNRTWSAKKLDEEKQSLKTEINSKVDEDDLHDILYDFVSDSHYEDVALSQIDGYNVYQHVPSTSKVQIATQSSTYRAYDSIAVTPGEQYRITIKNFKATYSRCFYVVDENNTFVYAPENTASDTTETIDFTIPSGGVAILINKKGTTPTPELKKLVTTGEWKPREIPSVKDPVYFEESDGTYYVRCEKDDTSDFVHSFDFNSNNSNPCLSFKYLKTIPHSTKDEDTITAFGSGSNYKGVNDDRCPLHLNGYYIGAGHGNPNYIKVTASNDKTEKDIGSIWSDGTNNFTIIAVGTGDFIIGCLQNNEVASVTLGSTLTHVSGATHTSSVTVTDSEAIQLRPCGNMFTHEIYGNKEIPAVSGRRYGEIRVVEKYNILRSDAIFSFLQANVGSNTNESYFDDAITSEMAVVENVYVFSRNGSITIYSAVEFKSSVDFDYFGVSQAIAMASSGNLGFVPDSSTLDTPTTISAKTNFTWNGDVIPYRFYQMLSDYSKGFGIIYETSAGYGNPTKRAGVCSESGSFANSSWKMYPHLFSPSVSAVNNGDYFSAIAARMPIQTSATMPTLCWYWVDDKVVLACDVASAFDGFIPLPEYLVNKKITPRDMTEGLTVQNDFVTQKGIRLKNTTNAIAHLVAELV